MPVGVNLLLALFFYRFAAFYVTVFHTSGCSRFMIRIKTFKGIFFVKYFMARKFRILLILYRDFISYNLIFTFCAGYVLLSYGDLSFPYLFWIKLAGFSALALGYYQTRKSRLYFYHNLGFSLKELAGYSFLTDTILSVFIFYLIYEFT